MAYFNYAQAIQEETWETWLNYEIERLGKRIEGTRYLWGYDYLIWNNSCTLPTPAVQIPTVPPPTAPTPTVTTPFQEWQYWHSRGDINFDEGVQYKQAHTSNIWTPLVSEHESYLQPLAGDPVWKPAPDTPSAYHYSTDSSGLSSDASPTCAMQQPQENKSDSLVPDTGDSKTFLTWCNKYTGRDDADIHVALSNLESKLKRSIYMSLKFPCYATMIFAGTSDFPNDDDSFPAETTPLLWAVVNKMYEDIAQCCGKERQIRDQSMNSEFRAPPGFGMDATGDSYLGQGYDIANPASPSISSGMTPGDYEAYLNYCSTPADYFASTSQGNASDLYYSGADHDYPEFASPPSRVCSSIVNLPVVHEPAEIVPALKSLTFKEPAQENGFDMYRGTNDTPLSVSKNEERDVCHTVETGETFVVRYKYSRLELVNLRPRMLTSDEILKNTLLKNIPAEYLKDLATNENEQKEKFWGLLKAPIMASGRRKETPPRWKNANQKI